MEKMNSDQKGLLIEMDSGNYRLKKVEFEEADKNIILRSESSGLFQRLSSTGSILMISNPSIQAYKKDLAKKLSFGFVFTVLLIIERTFHFYLQGIELDNIVSLQEYFGESLGFENETMKYIYYLIGKIGNFQTYFLLITHVLITLYVGLDALIALKIIVLNLLAIFFLSMLTLLLSEARPFWIKGQIQVFYCEKSYSNPGYFTFSVLFILIYTYRCFKGKEEEDNLLIDPYESYSESIQEEKWFKLKKWGSNITWLIIFICFLLILFIRILIGIDFFIDDLLSLMLFLLFYSIMLSAEGFLENLIKQSTILKIYSKTKAFKWLIVLLLIEAFSCVIYLQSKANISSLYLENMLNCDINIHNLRKEARIDELFHNLTNFLNTSCIFALIGLIFGASQTFRTITNINWYKGPLKHRILRTLIANLAMIPSWILLYYQEYFEETHIYKLFGINRFLVCCIHYFFLYYVLFGLIPCFVYLKLGLTFMDLRLSTLLPH